MKIVKTDNYGRDTESDVLVCENINTAYGTIIVNMLNNDPNRHHEDYFELLSDDYKLYEWEY